MRNQLTGVPALTVMHLIPMVGHASGGLGPVALGLSAAQRALGVPATVWSMDTEESLAALGAELALPPGAVRTFPVLGPERLAYSPSAERAALHQDGASYSVLHLHSIWTACSHLSVKWRDRYDRPTIIAPHGSLGTWALRRSKLRKRLATWAYESRNLHTASCIHALSEMEAQNIRDYGLTNPIAIIPNGLPEAWLASTGDGMRFRQAHQLPKDKRLLLFLSRITPIKGLPMLLGALAQCHPAQRDWLLVIAGPDEFNHRDEIQALADQLGISAMIHFVGALYGQQKRDAFAAAELFVLPSYSEGVPMAVLEALGTGIPVLATEAVPILQLGSLGCGWRVAIQQGAIYEALGDALTQSPDTLRMMGQKGRAFVAASYTWRHAAERSVRCYRWLLGEEEQPEFVLRH
ncbi:MAG: glycosyltransferase [Armatimonadota bacterium]